MRKVVLAGLLIVAALVAGGVLLRKHFRSQTPEALLDQLARGSGNKEELVMRLNVARGDVLTPMLAAFRDKSASPSYRADVLELLFKRNYRSGEKRIEEAILEAAQDSDTTVRRGAIKGLAVYAEERLQVALVDSIKDPDEEIRRQVYLVLTARTRGRDAEGGLWGEFSPEEKEKMIRDCLDQVKAEEEPEMRLLARAVLGREIEKRGLDARQALQGSDILGAEELLRSALALDGKNHQAQIRLIRFLLANGAREEALKLAGECEALIEVPQLSGAPLIDGDPTDTIYEEAWTTDRFYMTTSKWVARPMTGKSRAYIGHREGKIYICVVGYEEDLDELVVRNVPRDGNVWQDDCVELIFDPDITGKKYYQFVINPLGCLFDIASGNKSKNFKCEYKAAIFKERGYWACEFALDGNDLDNHPIRSGTLWSFVVFRVRIGAASEHGCIWPLFGGAHRMDLYPIAVFE